MILLVIGLIVFIGIHLVPANPVFRKLLVARLGEIPYKGLFSLVAMTGLVMIVYAKGLAEYLPVWQPPAWTRMVPTVLMIPAAMLLVAANFRARIKCYLRHPMMTGILLWAVAHLVANGDRASILLFGSFAIWSAFSMVSANRRGATLLEGPVSIKMDFIAVVVGLTLYAVLTYFHGALFGVSLTH